MGTSLGPKCIPYSYMEPLGALHILIIQPGCCFEEAVVHISLVLCELPLVFLIAAQSR